MLDLRHFDLEKEKEDETSPRGVLEGCVRDFNSLQSNESERSCSRSKSVLNWSKYFKNWKNKSFKRLASFPPLGVPKVPKLKSKSTRENQNPALTNLYKLRSSLVTFKLSELRNATNNFNKGLYISSLFKILI